MVRISGGTVTGVQIADVTVTEPRIRDVEVVRPGFWRVRMRGAVLSGVEIDGEVEGLLINGVDVGPLVEDALDRRYPDRPKMRPTDVAGYREAWNILESRWADTVDRARRYRPSCCTNRSTVSGRSCRRCGTCCSPPTSG